jgi:predicted nicotinamide N-methyase
LYRLTHPRPHPFAAEFVGGIYGEGYAVLRIVEDLSNCFATNRQEESQPNSNTTEIVLSASQYFRERDPHDTTSAPLSVKKFSRRQLLQTGGIATRVWTASVLLARWMARHMHAVQAISQCAHVVDSGVFQSDLFGSGGRRVLELGCGLGVAGIAAAMCGCSVLLTDIHGVALSACQDAIRLNADRLRCASSALAFVDCGHMQSIDDFLRVDAERCDSGVGRACTMELDWNNVPELPPQQRFSCIIAADVIHEDAHAPLVSRVIRVRALACQKKNCKDFL